MAELWVWNEEKSLPRYTHTGMLTQVCMLTDMRTQVCSHRPQLLLVQLPLLPTCSLSLQEKGITIVPKEELLLGQPVDGRDMPPQAVTNR